MLKYGDLMKLNRCLWFFILTFIFIFQFQRQISCCIWLSLDVNTDCLAELSVLLSTCHQSDQYILLCEDTCKATFEIVLNFAADVHEKESVHTLESRANDSPYLYVCMVFDLPFQKRASPAPYKSTEKESHLLETRDFVRLKACVPFLAPCFFFF